MPLVQRNVVFISEVQGGDIKCRSFSRTTNESEKYSRVTNIPVTSSENERRIENEK